MLLSDLQGLRVGVWGFGREGQALLGAMRSRGVTPAAITVHTDLPIDGDAAVGDSLTCGYEVSFVSEQTGLDALTQCEVVVRSPGVSIYGDGYKQIVAAGVRLTTGTNLWLAELPSNVTTVAVTGTKGKSTTASLIAHLARAADANVVLAGNIGTPLLATAMPAAGSIAVLELSSFQLADLTERVSLAVVLNVYREHLDWHGDEQTYRSDKLRLADAKLSERVILNAGEPPLETLGAQRPDAIWFGDQRGFHLSDDAIVDSADDEIVAITSIPLTGIHNALNTCAALAACEALGLHIGDVDDELQSFAPLPHRLQTLPTDDGRTWVNDSISTTPESTIAALESFKGRAVTLLVGGFERAQQFDELCKRISSSTEAIRVVGLPATGERIIQQIGGGAMGFGHVSLLKADDLKMAVEIAAEVTPTGGVVLLSPAAPSFGQFRDFEERGDRFTQLAQALTSD
ncbi:MAG: UDP-N-acetylmuramoyl-L-alanine--D-glutamate ligase [Thermoleophilaceae bacterium]|nr:UDP-N-acetylmuramoyl-L-alanine--D-glutamate ligase [Thermoleophilaceae bacterium]